MMAAGMCPYTSPKIWWGTAWVSLHPPVTSAVTHLLQEQLERHNHGYRYRAELKNCGVSAQKTRLVINLVRGKPAVEALTTLKFTNKVAAMHVGKLLASAVANAEENFGVSRDDLVIYKITADEAPTRKWRRFGARGRFKPLLRRSSHVTIVLREKE